jgi:hypothetical protein
MTPGNPRIKQSVNSSSAKVNQMALFFLLSVAVVVVVVDDVSVVATAVIVEVNTVFILIVFVYEDHFLNLKLK